MNILSRIADFARSPGDPSVISVGPSARPVADDVTCALGWFSLALGAVELVAPHRLTRLLGMEGKEGLMRAYGAREIAAGMTTLSTEKVAGLWSRVGGDLIDMATLAAVCRAGNPRKGNVKIAMAVVAGVMLLDLATAKLDTASHARRGTPRNYADRSGFPQGLAAARGLAGRATAGVAG